MTNSDPRVPSTVVPAGPLPRTAVPPGVVDPVESARAELKAALAAIEIKGNFPRRIEKASQRGILRARTRPLALTRTGDSRADAHG